MSTEPGKIEPADLDFVRTGDKWPYTFWQRDDVSAREAEYSAAERWYDCGDESAEEGPQTWEHVSSLPDPRWVQFTDLDSFAEPVVLVHENKEG